MENNESYIQKLKKNMEEQAMSGWTKFLVYSVPVFILCTLFSLFVPDPIDAIRSYFFGYKGKAVDVSYESDNYDGTITGSTIIKEGINYSYKGTLIFDIECRGEISAAYLIYGKDSDEITSGDISSCNVVKEKKGSYRISQEINLLSNRTEGYRKGYMLIKGGTGDNTVYCIAVNLSTVEVFYETEVVDNDGGISFIVKPYNNQNKQEVLEYEVKSEADIQSMVVDQANSYIAKNKREVLESIHEIKDMNLE